MKKKTHKGGHRERDAARQLRELCENAYHEQQSHNPDTALAFAGLAKVVPRIADRTPGWSEPLSRSFLKKGTH